jgi:hypothetical protein
MNRSDSVLPCCLILACNWILLKFFGIITNPQQTSGTLFTPPFESGSSVVLAVFSTPGLSPFAIAICAVAILERRLFGKRIDWAAHGVPSRIVVGVCVLMTAWWLVLSPHNFYFDNSHVSDRILLSMLALSCLLRPIAVPGFVLVAYTWFGELVFPFGYFHLSEKGAVLDVLVMFSSILAIGCVTTCFPSIGRVPRNAFVFFATIVHLQNYFWAGIEKCAVSDFCWIWTNESWLLVLAAKLDGFSPFWINDARLLEAIQHWNVVLNCILLLFELIVGIAFFSQRGAAAILFGCAILNATVFLLTGICFYEWAILSVVLGVINLRMRLSNRRLAGTFGLVFLLTATYWHHPHRLGWNEMPIINIIRFEATLDSGTRVGIAENQFAPYDRTFNYDEELLYFCMHPIGSRRQLRSTEQIDLFNQNVTSLDEFTKWQEMSGEIHFDHERIVLFEEFLRRFCRSRIACGDSTRMFRAPYHLYRSPPLRCWDYETPIRKVDVRYIQYVALRSGVVKSTDAVVHSVQIGEFLHE